ncbi:DBIRD complex subunit ZNF326-like isoform X2 [Lissotriton helveticus]
MEPAAAVPPLKEVRWDSASLPLDQLTSPPTISSYRLPQVDYGGMQRPGIVVDYQTNLVFGRPAGRWMKRKMMQSLNKPIGGAFVDKKPKLRKPGSNGNAVKKG